MWLRLRMKNSIVGSMNACYELEEAIKSTDRIMLQEIR